MKNVKNGNFYYPKFKIIVIFTTSSIGICLIILSYVFIDKYINNYGNQQKNHIPKEGYFYSIESLIISLLLMVPYNLIFSFILSLKKLTWNNLPWRNINTYISLMKANIVTGMIVFIPFIILDISVLISCIGHFISYSILSVIISGFILPKNIIKR